MTTKAKCMALADEHGMDISNYCYGSGGLVYGDWQISLPSGYQVELDGSMMTGLSGGIGQGTWSKVWAQIYKDMQALIAAGPWVEAPQISSIPVYTREQLESAIVRYQAEAEAKALAAGTDQIDEWYVRQIAKLQAMLLEAAA